MLPFSQAICMPDSTSLHSSVVFALPEAETVYQLSIKQPQSEPKTTTHINIYTHSHSHSLSHRQAPSITGRNGRSGPGDFTRLTEMCFISVFIFLALVVRFDLTPFQGALLICTSRQMLAMPQLIGWACLITSILISNSLKSNRKLWKPKGKNWFARMHGTELNTRIVGVAIQCWAYSQILSESVFSLVKVLFDFLTSAKFRAAAADTICECKQFVGFLYLELIQKGTWNRFVAKAPLIYFSFNSLFLWYTRIKLFGFGASEIWVVFNWFLCHYQFAFCKWIYI